METMRVTDHQAIAEHLDPSVVAVGFFDGLHRGHQHVIGTAKKIAEERGEKWGVMTFDPHPSVVLKGVEEARYLTPLPVKEKLVEEMGADYLFIVPFTKELASLSPEQFLKEYFTGLSIVHVVAGFDFSFGHKGKGNMQTIDDLSGGHFTTTTVEKVEEATEKISSTRIRRLLDEGNVEKANELLGRAYEVCGQLDREGYIEIPTYYHLPDSGDYRALVGNTDVHVKVTGHSIVMEVPSSIADHKRCISFLEKL